MPTTQPTHIPSPDLPAPIRAVLCADPPRATSFIVTIYGDVVEPRGGTLWMGTLIECCARHGISESLVRTAVSRLVGGGRLMGERIGRRSFYRLTGAGRAEFRRASGILFAPPPAPDGWLIAPGADPEHLPAGWVRFGGEVAIAPHHADLPFPAGPVLPARTMAAAEEWPVLAARHWPLDEVAQTYRGFIDRFAPVWQAGVQALSDDADALALRLRLVDEYRHAALTDPRLPAEALPPDWPAAQARGIFRRIYLALSDSADRHAGRVFADSAGLLPERTDETNARLASLRIL